MLGPQIPASPTDCIAFEVQTPPYYPATGAVLLKATVALATVQTRKETESVVYKRVEEKGEVTQRFSGDYIQRPCLQKLRLRCERTTIQAFPRFRLNRVQTLLQDKICLCLESEPGDVPAMAAKIFYRDVKVSFGFSRVGGILKDENTWIFRGVGFSHFSRKRQDDTSEKLPYEDSIDLRLIETI